MNFIEKIKAHQEGTYDFADELMDLALSDMCNTTMLSTKVVKEYFDVDTEEFEPRTHIRWRPQYTVKKDLEEYHLARNFKVMIARFIKKPNSARKSYQFEGDQEEIADFDVLDWIYRVLIDMDYPCYKDDFDKIPKSVFDAIEKKYGWDYYDDFMSEIKEFINILPYINREKDMLSGQIGFCIQEALYEVLPHVDTSRPIEDIKGYIAVSVRNRVPRKLTKVLGNRVMNRDGEKYYVVRSQMRLKQASPEGILRARISSLTANQALFYSRLRTMVQNELDAKNDKVFTLNVDGEPTEINKRYFAEKMGLNESAFKKRLTRIRTKSK